MAAAFPGPYTDVSITQRGPFSQVSTAVRPQEPGSNDSTRVYMKDRTAVPRTLGLPSQPKPPQLLQQFGIGSDPYKE